MGIGNGKILFLGTKNDAMNLLDNNTEIIDLKYKVVIPSFVDAYVKIPQKLIMNKEKNEDFIVLGDYDKLKQVFINLISNAIKFTNINGTVLINITSNINSVIIEISDNGIGIKKEDLPFIFERMYRGDKSRHKIEGSGLGLTLVKKILTLHSGTIDVESKENKGTKFTICISKDSKNRSC